MRVVLARLVAALVVAGGCAQSETGPDAQAPFDGGALDAPSDATVETDGTSCSDGVKDGAETDVDCGGSACPKCKDGSVCILAADCSSATCAAGTCGRRAWSAESNGSDVAVPGDQAWVDTLGLNLQPVLYAKSLVFLRWTGTLRWGGGGNGLCHVGQRFLIDGVPTGDPTWGDSIMVQNGATRWHENFTTELAVPLGPGLHIISAQMTNANGFGTCNMDGDAGAAYDRSRLAVSAHDPKTAWYVESTGETGPLAPGPFTDIPGVSASMTLPASRHVQASLTGSELVGGTGEGYCAYRLVIDGTPQGDPTQGQAIAVGDVATGWWAPVALKYGVDMIAGSHTISAQVSNSSSQGGTCNAGAGNAAYARFRLFVTSSPIGGPNVSAESTGPAQILGSTSPWTPVAGLSATFSISAPTQVQLEMAATEQTISGSGHCAWRFVIDGQPFGDLNHGQAINVGSSTTWWTETSLLWGQSFDTGPHTVSVDVSNSSNSGDCGTNGDGAPYGRAHLLVRAP
ncbi:MAG TPA: hypothetical protein VLM85_26410 [Polyangiaceae bacterium]|nr:hypothetical protein [Polyangiaceae bacterium]